MGLYEVLSILLLILAIGSNTALVYLQKNHSIYSRFGRHGLTAHRFLLTVFWGLFLASLLLLTNSSWQVNSSLSYIGWGLLLVAVAIFIISLKQIGYGGLINANFFGGETKKLRGIYNVMNDPIYVSYSLALMAAGFISGLVIFFILSAIAAIGLFGFESKVEEV